MLQDPLTIRERDVEDVDGEFCKFAVPRLISKVVQLEI